MIEIIPNWHPIFVHYTVALLSLSVGLHLINPFTPSSIKEQWQTVASWTLWFGVALTIVTGFTGLYAYNTVAHDTPSHIAMTDHRNWAIPTILVFLLLAIWSARLVSKEKALSKFFLVGMAIGGLLLGSTAWHGAELVYRHGLGVISLPKSDGEGHAHEHADGEGHDHGQSSDARITHPDNISLEGMNMDDMKMDDKGEDNHEHPDDGHDHVH